MQLIINTYGSYLQKNGECFKVKKDDQIFEVSVKKVSSILITTAAYITTDSIKLAIDNNIDIIFLDDFGDPFGRIWHPKLGSTTLIRRRQLEISSTQEGLNIVKKWIKTKFDNQINLLVSLRNTRTKKSKEITYCIEQLKNIEKKFDEIDGLISEIRDTIMGIEGLGAKIYFNCISFLMPDRYKFKERSRNPAKDEFNALLNYSYGILYSKIEKACIIAGLDPYVGILHTDHYNKKSMVFDIIENYRIWADEIVINLFAGRKVKQEHFNKLKNGLTLNKEGKAVLIDAYTNFMDESIRYKGRNIKRDNIIQFDCHRFANDLIENHKL
ncbi:MAG: CRISPR-associated endonuclease Cas1 [Candidatus Acididesulfobacter diazotrophicus]|jgi:CRISPR-associated protein Cas1|uniref:CRISPR-associated endonuclease Cas1 n=1 Tax=Candidatus Acididesulfobacter diazotrophicus TaxID=2597226 RepID=A0A519BMP9_9DELT|nr:MAG: CRISPR-associated endonuclease Cas1 [Candidatus Acididesulfobacter diazotrophicus]